MMTEKEWLQSADPQPMLTFLRGKASERRWRLFAVACCRGERYALCGTGLEAVAVAEDFADGRMNEDSRAENERTLQSLIPDDGSWSTYSLPTWALHRPMGGSYPLEYILPFVISQVIVADLGTVDEVISILRDIFGNPFRTIIVSPKLLAWHDGTAPKIAQSIYEERRFEDMSVLADALEEAGCTNADILNHCRREGPHVRGCWVLDLILGKQ